FDVSGLTYNVPSSQAINMSGGAWSIGGSSSASSASSAVNMTNGTLKITTMSTGTPNLAASTINLGSGPNVIQPATIPSIDVYPKTFIIASYTTLNGVDHTNTLAASLPAGGFPAFAGYVTVDTTAKQILLVLTNGPITPSLTWVGFNGGALNSTWDFVANDWTNKPAHTQVSYTDGSLVTFDDTARTNVSVNYSFIGSGYITGTNGFTKLGTGKLTLDNGSNDFTGGLSIGGGTVQLGTGGTGGWLGNGAIGDNGVLT